MPPAQHRPLPARLCAVLAEIEANAPANNAMLLAMLAMDTDTVMRAAMLSHMRVGLPAGHRAALRELALQAAEACSEASHA